MIRKLLLVAFCAVLLSWASANQNGQRVSVRVNPGPGGAQAAQNARGQRVRPAIQPQAIATGANARGQRVIVGAPQFSTNKNNHAVSVWSSYQ